MQISLYNQDGKETGKIELNDTVFAQEINPGLIHRALVYQLANARQVVAHTKTRSDRNGSTRKIYRQKGTGRARAGSSRSPVRRKGGVVFGPRNDANFELSMNRKERRKALFSALSAKAQKGLVIVDEIKLKEMKTKEMVKILNNLPIQGKTLFALPGRNLVLEKSAANIPTTKTLFVDYLNIQDLLKYETLLLTKESLAKIDKVFVK